MGHNGSSDRLTFDNIEIAKNVRERLTKKDDEEIFSIYQEAGRQAIERDKKYLSKLLEEGKITQEQYSQLVIKEVIAGRGYNDLYSLDSLSEAETIVPQEAHYSYQLSKYGSSTPWIDSTTYGAPTGSNSYTPVIIATMDKEKKSAIEAKAGEVHTVSLKDVKEWYGKVDEVTEKKAESLLDSELDTIRKIEKNVYRDPQQVLNNSVSDGYDIAYAYELEEASVVIGSEKNWYIIYGKDNSDNLQIADIALEGGINSNKNGSERTVSSRIATFEMMEKLYEIMINAAKSKTPILCNATRDTSLINIKSLTREKIIELYDNYGKRIILSETDELIYEDGTTVQFEDYNGDSGIDTLQLKMDVVDLDKLVQKRIQASEYLEQSRSRERLHGTQKEKGLDELRKQIRDDIEK